MRTLFLVFVFSAICISGNNANVESGSFLEADTDLRHLKRNLLQVVEDGENEFDEGVDEAEKETTTEAVIERKGIFERGTILKGPTLFYTTHDSQERTTFLMEVSKCKRDEEDGVKIKQGDGSWMALGEAASVKGGMIGDTEYSVTIDWKPTYIKMKFNRSRTDFTLKELEVRYNNKVHEDLTTTVDGYEVSAPIGLAWACNCQTTMTNGEITVSFPNIRLQVYFDDKKLRNFGPLWFCGVLMPIGLWVGLIVSLFFGFVCYWGFSMLANIQTMDRFDDPKGKQIYVPQTD